jgi:large subunit ribosomal protein L3
MAVEGIIGRKLGMTQVYDEDGRAIAVTVIEAGPCVVVQRKSRDKDGYSAAQVGLVESREFRLDDGDETRIGDKISVTQFGAGDTITVVGTSKGKGFQGVVRRHHFGGGAATHGSMFHRAPGSIGASAYPSRVLKGMRAAGHMGSDRVTVQNLRIVRVDAESNLLLVRGAVPGAGGGYLVIRRAGPAGK